jgi:hypothetical protein
MSVECPWALCRAVKNKKNKKKQKKNIPRISVSAVGMFQWCPTDIQRIGPMSEVDIFWTSIGLTCVMWVIESWLPVKGCDEILRGVCPAGYSGLHILWKGRRGGGVALIYRITSPPLS